MISSFVRIIRLRRQALLSPGVALISLFSFASAPASAGETSPPWPLDAFSTAVRANADREGVAPTLPTFNSFSDKIGPHLLTAVPTWLQRSEAKVDLGPDGQPQVQARSLLPLHRAGADAILMQSDMVHRGGGQQEKTDSGMGLGFRHLFAGDRWLVGANAFLDDGWSGSQGRGSFGGEIGAMPFGLRLNLYQPYTESEISAFRQMAAAGYDLNLRLQVPYIPAATASFENSSWEAGSLGIPELGSRFGLSFQPLSFLNLSGKIQQSGNEAASYAAIVRLSFKFDGTYPETNLPIFDDHSLRFGSMVGHFLDLFRRDETVPVVRMAETRPEGE